MASYHIHKLKDDLNVSALKNSFSNIIALFIRDTYFNLRSSVPFPDIQNGPLKCPLLLAFVC